MLFIPEIYGQLQYEGETIEDMDRRAKAILENNRRTRELFDDWERQRRTPMKSMISWAIARGLLPKKS